MAVAGHCVKTKTIIIMNINESNMPNGYDLSKIKSPADIRSLSIDELYPLAAEMRAVLTRKLAAHGGHVSPNLGFLEATIALHYVFDTPHDKIVFDVSHQTYVHKMLTGRIEAFINPEKYDDVTGYSSPLESPYDLFAIGHTSTSVALAAGVAKARDLKGENENVVAVIGDGSLSGGEAFEGLDYAAGLGSNFIVVVNDNQMSIEPVKGGIYDNLTKLRQTNGTDPCNYFSALGYRYIYVPYGNDIRSLVEAFRAVKDSNEPIVVHINTIKGYGLPVAERDKEKFHFSAPFDPKTGSILNPSREESYIDIFARHILSRMSDDPSVCLLTAGTAGAIGFTPERRETAGRQFIDVGIAEENAVATASGLAKGGCKPVFADPATFIQRTYDQLSQDVSINRQPVTFVTVYSGVWGMNDMTHLGFFDVPMISNIPGILFLAPTNAEEYLAMLDWAIDQTEMPVVVRTPGGPVIHTDREVDRDYSDVTYQTVEQGEEIAVIAAGSFFALGYQAVELMKHQGLKPTLINPRMMSHVDAVALDRLRDYRHVITLEDNALDGGMGQKIAAYLGDASVKVHCLGLPTAFPDRYNASELLEQQGLTPHQIVSLVL